MDKEEEILLEAAVKGNVDAFSSIITKYSSAVYAIAYHMLGDFHAAQDVAQEVFVKAWFNLSDLKDKGKIGRWLHSIAKRLSIDWLRKNSKVLEPIATAQYLPGDESVESIVEQREKNVSVWQALSNLDEKHRQVTVMYYMSGFNTREISRFLGLSLSAVESRLRRSKQKLKKELIGLVQETLSQQKLGKEFKEKVVKRITGLACINLPVKDAAVSSKWYEKHLGCTLIREARTFSDGTVNAIIKLGEGPTVLLHQEKDQTKIHFIRDGKPAPIFELLTEDIEGFYAQLKQEGVTVTERSDNLPCGKYFQVEDPDGNMITIIEC